MKKVVLTLGILIFFSLCASCQPTPETEAVVNKGLDLNLSDLTSDENEIDGIPDHVEEEYDTGHDKLTITFAADVDIPETAGCPVIRLERMRLSDTHINEMMAYFMPNAQFYYANESTKAQLEAELLKYKQGIKAGDKYVPYEDIDDLIAQIEQEILTAPDREDLKIFDVTQVADGEEFSCYHFYDDITAARIYGTRKGQDFHYFYREDMLLQLESWVMQGDAIPGEPEGTMIGETDISKSEAIQKANKVIDDLSIDNMALARCEKARAILDDDSMINGWNLSYKREANGVLSPDVGLGFALEEEYLPTYTAPWNDERIEMFIMADGVLMFIWDGASVEIETLTENAMLIDFGQVITRIGQQLKYMCSWTGEGDERDILVDRITLGLSAISVQNEPDEALLIPTWYARYRDVNFSDLYSEWILFSALDGSYIEPRMTNEMMEQYLSQTN